MYDVELTFRLETPLSSNEDAERQVELSTAGTPITLTAASNLSSLQGAIAHHSPLLYVVAG